MEPINSISIPTTTADNPVFYNIHVKFSNTTTTILSKRYNDFYILNTQLLQQIAQFESTPSSLKKPPADLPPKDISTFWKSNDVAFIENRRKLLEKYLQGILYCKDYRWRKTDAWKQFLQIPKSLLDKEKDEQHLYSLVSHQAVPNAPLSFENWLNEYNQCQEQIREIRALLHQRI
jgi:regulator of vacuolar morphogenesis